METTHQQKKSRNWLKTGLLVFGAVLLGAFLYDTFRTKKLEELSVEELKELLKRTAAKDTAEAYLDCAAIRDTISMKTTTG